MDNHLTRRDFLKLAALLPVSLYLPKITSSINGEKPNVLVIIFDSWSASNTSLYGYPRKTTPNIDKLAKNAIVYHNHYASGHYTYPSTASFLTGVLPWEHKGYWSNPYENIQEPYYQKNIFHYLPEYYRSACTHNSLANGLLVNMAAGIDKLLPKYNLSIIPNKWYDRLFSHDEDISILSWIRNLENLEEGFANSVFLSRFYRQFREISLAKYREQFPRGIPAFSLKDNFVLETAIDWVAENLQESATPFFSYIHLLPPHSPYRTRREFVDQFKSDGFIPIKKPHHLLGQKPITYQEQVGSRRMYDEYLLYADSEFQRLMENLAQKGGLENTIVILTSDHGEMFERGIPEHGTPSFHNPLVHVPLLIFPPGQQERIDIHALTTTVDLLPTILHLTGNPTPAGLEGELIPPFQTENRSERAIITADFRLSPKSGPLSDGTIMIRAYDYKFTYFFGTKNKYSKLPDSFGFELFDLANDREEMENLFDPSDSLSQTFLQMMEDKLLEKNLELVRYN
ncbi:MAG: sulfatase [Anaerolineales bacterium]|nr:sulfatase [Anaerolineales bacterium]